MSPRPKRVSDAELIVTAAAVVAERGAGHVRFADVAAASGLAPATLVQRFGTLEAMLHAVTPVVSAELAAAFRRPAPSALSRLDAALTEIAVSSHLAFLLARPAAGAGYSLELRKQIGFCLAAAIEGNEVPHCDVATLTRRIQLGLYGLLTAALLEGAPVKDPDIQTMLSEVLGDLL